jgi:predicted nucleotidyltransferase
MASRADLIESIVAHVVAAVHPTRVVLFGSHARGDARADSDVDLLVVIPDGADRRAASLKLYTLPAPELSACPVDFIVTTESEFARRQNRIGSIYPSIAREGRELYAAA